MCWVYFTIDCVSINYTVFAVVLILYDYESFCQWVKIHNGLDDQPL